VTVRYKPTSVFLLTLAPALALVGGTPAVTRLVRLSPDGAITPWTELPGVAWHVSSSAGRVLLTMADGRVLEVPPPGVPLTLYRHTRGKGTAGPSSAVALGKDAIAVASAPFIEKIVHGRVRETLARLPDRLTWTGMTVNSASDDGRVLAAEIWQRTASRAGGWRGACPQRREG
jgi:hypothetical protein